MKNAIEEKVEMTAEEASFIDRFTAAYCRPHQVVMAERLAEFIARRQFRMFSAAGSQFAMAAGKSAPAAAVEAPDEEVRFAFASDGAADAEGAWRAELVVPPKAVASTMLTVKVVDRAGAPAAGVFSLAGVALPLVEGRAEILFGQFLAGIKDTDVGLTVEGVKTPGGLMFF